MNTDLKATVNPQSNEANTEGREKTPVFHLQSGVRAGGFRSDEAWAAANFDQIEQFFNQLQAKFGTNI